MPTLNFSFSGESVNASRLQSTVRKFELRFEQPSDPAMADQALYSVECYFTISRYAEDLSMAFHMAALEHGIDIARLAIQITGVLESAQHNSGSQKGLFNRIDVCVLIASEASTDQLDILLGLARELNPAEAFAGLDTQLHFSLHQMHHLN
jgi:hypothetical protein